MSLCPECGERVSVNALYVQPWSNTLATNNFVLYQVFRSGDAVSRPNPTVPNSCVVEGVSKNYPSLVLGLGTVHANCRVNHFGGQSDNSATAWTDNTWTSYSQLSPKFADEAINLYFRFPSIGPGASVTFTWMYAYTAASISSALDMISAITIQQPVDTVSGTSATFSAMVNVPATSVAFYVLSGMSSTLVGVATTASPVDASTGGGLFSIVFNSASFTSGDGYVVREERCGAARVCLCCTLYTCLLCSCKQLPACPARITRRTKWSRLTMRALLQRCPLGLRLVAAM